MSAVPTNVGVFGQVDKRDKRWYWADTQPTGAIRGPFETKGQAVEDALQSLRTSSEMVERGAV
jgi:hypothetical protein